MIDFRRETKTGRFLDPRVGFDEVAVESEVRVDPLTGETGRICHFAFSSAPPSDLGDIVAKSEANCPFCGNRVHSVTPRFTEADLPEGRLTHGDAVLFPNLFPYDDVSAIAAISSAHFHPMNAIPEQMVVDGLSVARAFFSRVESRLNGGAESYGIVTWNYMPPSGGSQVHPHMQVVHTVNPGNALRLQLEAARRWRKKRRRSYVSELVEAEHAASERWIGATGSVLWLAPFVPTGLLGDCMAVFPERATLGDLNDDEIADFAGGLRRILAAFAARGLWSFNLVFLPDHAGADARRHWLTARLVPRLYINPALHVTDVAYMQLILGERFAMTFPEDVAASLRAALNADPKTADRP